MAETVEEYLPEEYEMLINEVANNLESSSGDEESESEDFSPSYESFDSEDEDSEDSADLYDSEDDSEDEDSEDMGDFVAKKDNDKKLWWVEK